MFKLNEVFKITLVKVNLVLICLFYLVLVTCKSYEAVTNSYQLINNI